MTRCPGGIWSGERGASQASERSVHTRPDSAVGALLCSEFATPPRVLGATGLDGSGVEESWLAVLLCLRRCEITDALLFPEDMGERVQLYCQPCHCGGRAVVYRFIDVIIGHVF